MKLEIAGQIVSNVRPMTDDEMDEEGWDVDNCSPNPTVIVLGNGVHLYPSGDSEGNHGGALFGFFRNKHFTL